MTSCENGWQIRTKSRRLGEGSGPPSFGMIVGCRGVPTLLRPKGFSKFAYQFKPISKFHRQIALLRQRIEHRLPFCWRWIKFRGHVVGLAFHERCTDRCSGCAFVERFSVDQQHHVDKVLGSVFTRSPRGSVYAWSFSANCCSAEMTGTDGGVSPPKPSQSSPVTISRGSSTSSPTPTST